VLGHPGSTDRLDTLAQLEFLRDHSYPLGLTSMKRRLGVVRRYATRGPEEARQASGMIFGIENGLKAQGGEYQGLKDPVLMAKKAKDEQAFRTLVASKPEWQKAYGDAWDTLAATQQKLLERLKPFSYQRLGGYRLPNLALTLVRYVAETAKPDGERLPEFHDAGLDSLRFRLFSPAPVYPAFEEVLGGKSPDDVAKTLIAGTKLGDPAVRKALVEGGAKAVAASTDPLIVLARTVDPMLREQRKWYEDNIEAVQVPAAEKIGKARFAVYGKAVNPDATFTLRMSYGAVAGYPMNGTKAPSITTFYGIYDRSASFGNKPPFDLPAHYVGAQGKLDLATPLNFVSTCDIIGGNSGSPVINRAGEIVGLVFDGNIESLVGRFVFDDTANRTVSVHTAGMTEALAKLYGADRVLKELLGI
jgi:hypothetical protein